MSKLWTICGTGRGVGKTHLALALCEILPDSVYAKLGGGRYDPKKPENLFRTEDELEAFINARSSRCQHIVVEANVLARKGTGDLIIFIDGTPEQEDPREDREELRAISHIVVSPDADTHRWRRVLRASLSDSRLVENAFGLLVEQKRFLCGTDVSVRSKVWFVIGEERVFGTGLARLLDNIDRLGSLSEAARTTKISYRRAWDLIKEAEKRLGKKLILPQAGGQGGGRSELSDDGRRLLEAFNTINREVAAYADARFVALRVDLKTPCGPPWQGGQGAEPPSIPPC